MAIEYRSKQFTAIPEHNSICLDKWTFVSDVGVTVRRWSQDAPDGPTNELSLIPRFLRHICDPRVTVFGILEPLRQPFSLDNGARSLGVQ